MSVIDFSLQKAKSLQDIKCRVHRLLQGPKCNIGAVRWLHAGAIHQVEVENDGQLGGQIAEIVRGTTGAKVLQVAESAAFYDWQTNYYTRPLSFVSFTV